MDQNNFLIIIILKLNNYHFVFYYNFKSGIIKAINKRYLN